MVPGTLPSEGTPFRVERSRFVMADGLVSVVIERDAESFNRFAVHRAPDARDSRGSVPPAGAGEDASAGPPGDGGARDEPPRTRVQGDSFRGSWPHAVPLRHTWRGRHPLRFRHAGLEAAVSGLLRKPDRVLNLVNGKFSERFHELCQVFTTPTALSFEWGTAVEPEKVAAALDADAFRAVTLCWNETSTGLTNPIADIAKVAKEHEALLIVDGITAVGGLENRMEAWGIDALVVGSQKCLAAPPGLSAVALSKAAYESLHSDTSFYANLKAHTDALAKQDTPYTPAVPGGQGPLKGHIFRIGHMGICSFEDLEAGFQAFETTLASMGHKTVRGAAVDAIARHA